LKETRDSGKRGKKKEKIWGGTPLKKTGEERRKRKGALGSPGKPKKNEEGRATGRTGTEETVQKGRGKRRIIKNFAKRGKKTTTYGSKGSGGGKSVESRRSDPTGRAFTDWRKHQSQRGKNG